jgi:hypothetical protein
MVTICHFSSIGVFSFAWRDNDIVETVDIKIQEEKIVQKMSALSQRERQTTKHKSEKAR